MAELTPEEIQSVVAILGKLEPGLLPVDIFRSIARLMTTCTVVLIPFVKQADGSEKVLLLRRDTADPFYPGLYHPPGTILRASDETIKDAVLRILAKELLNPTIAANPVFVGYVFDEIVRGKEVSLIHRIEIAENPEVGDLFAIDNLPKDIIENDIPRIRMAAEVLQQK